MKQLLAVLYAATALSVTLMPQAYAQAFTAEQQTTFDAATPDEQAVLLEALGLTPEQAAAILVLGQANVAKLLSLPAADFVKVAGLPAAELANVASLPIATLSVVAALEVTQLTAVGTLPAAQLEAVVALPAAERTAVFTAVTDYKTAATTGNTAAVPTLLGTLNTALGALGTQAATFTAALGQDILSAVSGASNTSSARTSANLALSGLVSILPPDAPAAATLTTAAADVLQDAPPPTEGIGSNTPTSPS